MNPRRTTALRRLPGACTRLALALWLAAAGLGPVGPAWAAPAEEAAEAGPQVPWTERRTRLQADNLEIVELLRQVAGSNRLPIQVDERVRGTVSGSFNLPPQQLFDKLSRSHGFVWFYDGHSIIVSPISEVKTEMMRLSSDALSQLNVTLRKLGLFDPRFPVRLDAENRLAIFSGPARYVDTLLGIARGLQDAVDQRAPTEVLVYPLKYAWADDRTIGGAGGSVVVPGVVSVMKGIYRQSDERFKSAISTSLSRPRAKRPLVGPDGGNRYSLGDPASDDSQALSIRQTVTQALQAAGTGPGAAPAHLLPVIVADVRRNAVLVRDIVDRLPRHRALIQELDARAPLVEIEAQIVDVRSEELENLGLDWRLGTRRVGAQFGNGDAALQFGSQATPSPVPTLPTGGQVTVVAGNAASFLMSRLSALESTGKARTVATPRVTTVDNVQSVMSAKDVFYVKVPGAYASDLFEVTAGVSLAVQPFVVQEDAGLSVRMAINITDGTVNTGSTVGDLPSTYQSEITAEAIVRDGASLVIAGYAREEESDEVSGVPVLSSLPGIGRLLQHKNKNKNRSERLFLVTPRVVQP